MTQSNVDYELRHVLSTESGRNQTLLFLTYIFHLFPEQKFIDLLTARSQTETNEEQCYRTIQDLLPTIKPFLSEITYALPSLSKQKSEMLRQTISIPGFPTSIRGYIEVGSPGRYISAIRKVCRVQGDVVLVNESAPSYSPTDIAERGGITKIGRWLPLAYNSEMFSGIEDESIDVLTVYIGLHHAPVDELPGIIAEIKRVLAPNGLFVMRDHDVQSMEMATFVSFAHTVYNIGTNVPWEVQKTDVKIFRSAIEWSDLICRHGFTDTGVRVLQENDPTLNTLLAFRRT